MASGRVYFMVQGFLLKVEEKNHSPQFCVHAAHEKTGPNLSRSIYPSKARGYAGRNTFFSRVVQSIGSRY